MTTPPPPPHLVRLTLNGRHTSAWLPPHKTLLAALREDFGSVDVKYGCGEGVCGTCTVLLDGEVVNACLLFAVQVDGRQVVTLSGLAAAPGQLHPLQERFLTHGGSQCGFCTPGMVLTAHDHLERGGAGDRAAIRQALAGNLCRCTGYVRIVDAVEAYAAARRTDDAQGA